MAQPRSIRPNQTVTNLAPMKFIFACTMCCCVWSCNALWELEQVGSLLVRVLGQIAGGERKASFGKSTHSVWNILVLFGNALWQQWPSLVHFWQFHLALTNNQFTLYIYIWYARHGHSRPLWLSLKQSKLTFLLCLFHSVGPILISVEIKV